MQVEKINSEYHFYQDVGETRIKLIAYIDYEKRMYDIMQPGEEGIFPRKYNTCTEINIAFAVLLLDALTFINKKLKI